ncbi:uncharacterized protein LOC117192422 isoform X2 [Drosophila miranda]|uniref:uncharacterized protein LOC117192422 isoform X2 n=1 Tax=Drosophila miranda TaxID=7229 RepID=UPI00143F1E98|nr:uncharacterized protein LOC117192422 isoform X2 [Drosophila miranda]
MDWKRTIFSRCRVFSLFTLCASGFSYYPSLGRLLSAGPLDASARNTSCRSVDTNSRYRTPPSLTRRFTFLAVGFIRARERVTTAGHSSRLTARHRELSADLVWGHDAWRWSSGRRASARSPGHDACRPSFGRSPWPGSGHRQGPLSHGSARNTSCRSVDTNSRYRTPPSLTRRFTFLAVGFIRARERVTTAGHSSRLTARHRELSADLVWGHDAWRWSSGRRASARSPGHDACRPSFGRSPWPGSGHRQGPLSHGSARNTSCRSVDTNSRYRTPPSLTRRFTFLAVGFIRARERVTTAGHSSRLTARHRELSADLVWGHDAWRWSSGRRASARSPGHDACRPSFGRSPWPGSGHRQGPLSHGSGLATCCPAPPWICPSLGSSPGC